ncbi:MAG: acetyl-CoA carboxylase biotin carboxyl carrier protein [Oscillospiraceae bacterium]|nr:acetyl-CoA carboxylase biotin carboxyl carrier protein [Oscillospiraceae bacterium]
MDIIKTANELAELLSAKDLGSVFARDGEREVSITAKVTQYQFAGGAVPSMPVAPSTSAPADVTPIATTPASGAGGNVVTSPMVGTFYSAPAPEKPAFVKVGDSVKKGQVVCIVEAMKLMNEITSEFDGTVAEILVKDGDLVDFGKEMIRIS